ncbi:hypothetical protein FXO21_12520 [Dyadobacter sp. UC 10]|nr:hypothetical protein FXO21_12520 [Dyadobacter sp. UC 10]
MVRAGTCHSLPRGFEPLYLHVTIAKVSGQTNFWQVIGDSSHAVTFGTTICFTLNTITMPRKDDDCIEYIYRPWITVKGRKVFPRKGRVFKICIKRK